MKNLNTSHKADERIKRSRSILKKFIPAFAITGFLVITALIVSTLSGTSKAINFIFQDEIPLKHTGDQVNVLLLGNAGGKHDGPNLTDTIMVASINLKTNKVYLISLPRDLWIDETKSKINAVYEYSREKEDGLYKTKSVVSQVLAIPVHYGIRVDFGGFMKAVDLIEGIEVEVEKGFDDYRYPIEGKEDDLCGFKEEEREFNEEEADKLNIEPGQLKVFVSPDGMIATDAADPKKGMEYFSCRYEHISFKAGVIHMDGETALKFVRSRMGTNKEGTDFARSRRQQKVLEAFRGKILSLETLTNPQKIKSLVDTFGQSIETDISITDTIEFIKIAKKIEGSTSVVIDDSEGKGLLVNPPMQNFSGAYVLVPKSGSFDIIHQYVKAVLEGEVQDEATPSARSGSN